ncbi:MAG: DUF3293 domain-containing protein [Steroidobacteraceae bacterium]
MTITLELLSAFRSTMYLVDLPAQRVQLQVDTPNEPLREWLASQGHFCAALLTAHNPAAQRRDAPANQAAQRRLHALLAERGLAFRTGCNVDPQQRWPAEDSVLVADLPLPQAHKLAVHFGQLAFLWCDTSGVPKLHLAASD